MRFRETVDQLLRDLIAASRLPLKLWVMDESRFGLQTIQRRRLTLRGVKPLGVYQHQFLNFYIYGAVAPLTGEGLFESHEKMNGATFQGFVDQLGVEHPDSLNVMLVDNARTHHAKALVLPSNVKLLFLPPYAPELNPAERVWQAIKDQLAWQCFDELEPLRSQVMRVIEALEAPTLHSLTAYPYLLQALTRLSPARPSA